MQTSTRSPILTVALFLCLTLVAGARETKMTGKLTTTEDQALYGAAILRSAPNQEAGIVQKLVPGARVVVYPDTSPPGWWFIEMTAPGAKEAVAGYVPRDFVRSAKKGPFQDVPGDHWAASALHRLKVTGALTGTSAQNREFEGERALTRYELATLLDRAIGRLAETRREIDRKIAELPAKMEEAAERMRELDALVPKLDALVEEETQLRAAITSVSDQVEKQDARIVSFDDELSGMVEKDRDQNRRLDELARATESLQADVARARQHQASLDPEIGLQATLSETLDKVDKLELAARVLEARVEEVEAVQDGRM